MPSDAVFPADGKLKNIRTVEMRNIPIGINKIASPTQAVSQFARKYLTFSDAKRKYETIKSPNKSKSIPMIFNNLNVS